jgi:Rieske Fe-S protein
MKRRGFVKLCASAVASVTASPELLAGINQPFHRYGRVALIDPHSREPVRAASLEVGEAYLFHYPFVSTPCFLIDLGKPVTSMSNLKTGDGDRYRWQGGSGVDSSVVAFSAICAHKMSHPTPSVSFINYRHGEVKFRNSSDEIEQRSGVIYCCSENSVYDPAHGASVLGGPAPQPLAAIVLEYDAEEDTFYATATIGGEMYDRYFNNFHDRLVLQYGRTDIDQPITDATELMRLRDYTSNQVGCQA